MGYGTWLRGTRTILDVLASVAMIGIGVFFLTGAWSRNRSDPPDISVPREPVSLDGSFRDGNPDAKHAVMVFTDFQCPFCARLGKQVVPELRAEYVLSDRLQLSIRHLPLAIHRNARRAAAAALCSVRWGQFWPMHDKLFATPERLSEDDLVAHARDLGISGDDFRSCMLAAETERAVLADLRLAEGLGIRSTPTLLIGQVEAGQLRVLRVISGAMPFESLRPILDDLTRE